MDAEPRTLVQESWPAIELGADRVSAHFYERLFELDPASSALFASTDMVAQRQKLMQMLAEIVRVLGEPERLVPEAAGLARRHVGYGVHASQYDTVGESLQWALARELGDAFTPALRAAWAEAYLLLASVMRRAAARAPSPS